MELLEILNSWWKSKEVGKELALPYKRVVFSDIEKLIGKKQIIIISGLRRVGKSTIIFQIINKLLNSGINSENLVYFSFDDKTEEPLKILEKYQELTKIDWKKEKCFVFFDEIQKIPDWGNKIKIIYDNFPNLKIIVSGSSSFQLEKEAKTSLAGRHFLINIEPLSFQEYLDLRKSRIELKKDKLWEKEIKYEFQRYLLRPFPELVNFEELNLVKSYIKDNVIEKVLRFDLPSRFKDINEDLLHTLVEMFYNHPGMYLNFDELSKELKISKKTLVKHIFYLDFSKVTRRVRNFRQSIKAVSRKMQRIYPYHWSLQFGWLGNTNSESIVASAIDAKYYWRDKEKEIDFLLIDKKTLPIEVKESSNIGKNDVKNIIFFCKEYNLNEALIVYNGEENTENYEGVKIRKIPFWKFCVEKQGIKR